MKMHFSKFLPTLAVVGCLSAPTVLANDGFYVGIQGGKSLIDTNEDIFDLDDDVNYQGFVGWKFVDWLGVDLGYTQLGEFEGTYHTQTRAIDTTINIDAVTLGLSFWGDFGWGMEVFAKLGGYYGTTEWDTRDNNFDENDVGAFYQAGLLFPINDTIGITLSWQYFYDMEVLDGGTNASIDMFDVGVVLQF
jgi:hypothetical protein